MKVHKVKIYKQYADAILSGEKTFEIRYNDKRYQKDDRLKFSVVTDDGVYNCYDHELNEREYDITYVHRDLGMKNGYVALAIRRHIEKQTGEQE